MIIGAELAKKITQNTLAAVALDDVISFFEIYASFMGSSAQIIYFRILLLLLQESYLLHVWLRPKTLSLIKQYM